MERNDRFLLFTPERLSNRMEDSLARTRPSRSSSWALSISSEKVAMTSSGQAAYKSEAWESKSRATQSEMRVREPELSRRCRPASGVEELSCACLAKREESDIDEKEDTLAPHETFLLGVPVKMRGVCLFGVLRPPSTPKVQCDGASGAWEKILRKGEGSCESLPVNAMR